MKLGRKKSLDQAERTARITIRVRPGYLDDLRVIAEATGDSSVTGLLDRLSRQEAKRLKMPLSPR